jgi:hypothetical protein
MQKILVQFDFPEGTQQQHDQIWKELKEAGYGNPKGLRYHVSVSKPEGGILAIDVWESEELLWEFGKALLPILQKQPGMKAEPKIYPVHTVYERPVASPEPLK